jgi:peptidoglycan-N-acetylglucosamine deacetylase
VLTIDPMQYPRLGTMQYPETLPLADKEVVLTFDDGPMPPYTNRILEILAGECVKVNYFIIGRMARGYPDLLKRIHAEGHVIGTHSENHPLAFDKMPLRNVHSEVEQGIASTAAALGNRDGVAPFFRIPGLLRSDSVDGYLRSRRLVNWSADLAADDWRHIPASEVVRRTITRLDEKGRGIVLLHDIQPATALALPSLLKELKGRGYRVVQVRPAAAPVLVASGLRQQTPAAAQQSRAPFPAVTPSTPRPEPMPSPTLVRPAAPPPFPATTPGPQRAEPVIPQGAVQASPVLAPQPVPARPADTSPPEPAPPVPPETAASASAAPTEPVITPSEPMPEAAASANASAQPVMPSPVAPPALPAPAADSVALGQLPAPQATRPLAPILKPAHGSATSGKVSDLPQPAPATAAIAQATAR